jgi:ATP-dependent RNA helicase HelY
VIGQDHRSRFVDSLAFGLDRFQLEAIDAIDEHVNVLVSAPTGSGKTLVANYAIGRVLERGERAFYTTPLKALSNQKYHELSALYGSGRVGLLTGDTSINRSADVIVMTTEVLRNMLLTESSQLMTLGLVVLDEVHYLQDPFRGGVWEEVIILTPSAVRFVALSATIGNADFIGEWFSEVRGPTTIVVEKTRPIQLHNHLAVVRRGQPGAEILDLLDGARLSDESRRIDNLMKATRKFRPGPKWKGPKTSAPPPPFRAPRRSELLAALEREDLLPVIVFIFSRAACDDAVHQCRRDGLMFTTPEERHEIERIAHARLAGFSDEDLRALEYDDFVDCLRRGLSMHHAGMVPAFREIVEACFELNLLAVVFATETLALGVNMPARSVALERFSKYSDAGRKFLTSGEFSQMTGRAGRRGLDDEGHAIVCFANEVALADVGRVALAPALVVPADVQLHCELDQPLRVRHRPRSRSAVLRPVRDRPSTDRIKATPGRSNGGSPPRPRRARLCRGLAAHGERAAAAFDLPRVRLAHRRVDQRRRLRGARPGPARGPTLVLRVRVQARVAHAERRSPGDHEEEAHAQRPPWPAASRKYERPTVGDRGDRRHHPRD